MNFFTVNFPSLLQEETDKISALSIFHPLFLRKTLALFHKVSNSYSAVIAAQWPRSPVRMIMAISHLLAQMHGTGDTHGSWSGSD